MKEKLYIYGAGGLGREVLGLVHMLDNWEAMGFIDDGVAAGKEIAGVKVLGDYTDLPADANIVIAIGDPLVKKRVAGQLGGHGFRFPSLVHPSALLQDRAHVEIGAGSIVAAGCIFTTNIYLGDHVLINLSTTIGHDVSIGDHSSIMPGVNIAGEVEIGSEVLIGSGANIMNRIKIGKGSKVGMGSVVIHNVAEGETVVGVPAKPVKR